MKISAKTLKAASRAAEARGMSLDRWADEVLAAAAATSGHPSRIDAQLREISEKIDRIADRQSLGERASEQLAGAVQEMGASYQRVRESAGQVMGEAESRTSSAVEEMTAKARDLIDRASKSAGELFGTLVPRTGPEAESATEPTRVRPSSASKKSRAKKGTKTAGPAGRRSGAKGTTKSEKSRGAPRRRSPPKSRT
jgi:hypothetical protein